MEPWRAMDAHNGGAEDQNGGSRGKSVDQWSQILITFDEDRIRIEAKSRIGFPTPEAIHYGCTTVPMYRIAIAM